MVIPKYESFYFDGNQAWSNIPYLTKKLKKRRYLVELEKKDILVKPGEKIDTCYLLDKGSVIFYNFSNGNRRIIDYCEKNTLLFCEHVIFERPANFFCEALEQTQMYSIEISLVKKLLEKDVNFAKCFMNQITRNHLVTQDLLQKTVTHSARWRICDFMLIFAGRDSTIVDGNIVLNQRFSQQLLADMLYLNRITVLRELHTMEELGLCVVKNSRLVIPDIQLLKEYRDRYE